MTNTMQNPIDCTREGHTDSVLYALRGPADAGRFELEAGHEYAPMDVYVDPEISTGSLQDPLDRKGIREYLPMDVYVDLGTRE